MASENPRSFDAIILGGGAAGMMCAREAARRGRKVVVLERNDRLGKKILISGGGRCNFTNLHASGENYLSGNPDFCKSALARYTPHHFIEEVEKHGIVWHEKKLGQLFCSSSSRLILDMLERDCREAGVEFCLSCQVQKVQAQDGGYRVEGNLGCFSGKSLVVATGGLSFPQMGATDLGYQIARQFDLKIVSPCPALVPLLWAEKERQAFGTLSGISLDVSLRCGRRTFRENLLLTHKGISGPSVLQISSYWKAGEALHVNLLPDQDAQAWMQARAGSSAELANLLGEVFPRRFAQAWCQYHGWMQPVKKFSKEEINVIAGKLQDWEVLPKGDEGYSKAEVTRGGVDTSELSSKTMEAHRCRGLYFIGEVVDVTGWLGGFNFQWAWASGHAAGEVI